MKKTCTALIVLFLFALTIGGVYFNWGGPLVTDGIEKGLQAFNGISMVNRSVRGNPIGGYRLGPMRFMDSNGVTIATVDSMSIKIDLLGLLKKKISLSKVMLEGVRVEELLLSEIPRSSKGSSSSIEVQRIDLKNVAPLYGGGWKVNYIGGKMISHGWKASFDGSWRGESIGGEGTIALKDRQVVLEGLNIVVAGGQVSANGLIYPGLKFDGSLEDIDLARIANLYRPFEKLSAKGILGSSYSVEGRLADPHIYGQAHMSNVDLMDVSSDIMNILWDYDDKALSLSLSGSVLDSSVVGSVSFDVKSKALSLDVKGDEVQVDRLHKLMPWLSFMDDAYLGEIRGRFSGPLDDLSGRFDLKGGRCSIYDLPLTDVSGYVTMKEGLFSLNLSGRTLGSSFSCKGDVKDGLDLSIVAPGVDLASLRNIWSDLASLKLNGKARVDVALKGPFRGFSLSGSAKSDRIRVYDVLVEKPSATVSYKGDRLTIGSVKGSVGGASLSGSGQVSTVKDYRSELTGSLNKLKGSDLVNLIPALKSLDPRGVISANWSYKGPVKSGEMSLDLKSSNLSLYGMAPLKDFRGQIQVKDGKANIKGIKASLFGGSLSSNGSVDYRRGVLDVKGSIKSVKASDMGRQMGFDELSGTVNGSFSVGGKTSSPQLTLKSHSDLLKASGLELKPLSLSMNTSGEVLKVAIDGKLAGAPLSGGGQVRFASGKKAGSVDVEAITNGLDLASVLPGFEVGGTLSLKLHLLGDLGKVKFYVDGKAPRLQFGNVNFSDVKLGGFAGTGKGLSFSASSQFGDKRINASCDLAPKGGLNFKANGDDVHVSSFSQSLDGVLDGRIDLDIKGTITSSGISAGGEIKSSKLVSHGIVLSKVYLPMILSKSKLSVQKGKASLYGSPVSVDWEMKLDKKSWDGKASVKDLSLESLLVSQGVSGISGKGDLKLDMNGIAGRAFLMNINGFFRGKSVEIKGYPVIDAVTKGAPLRVRDVMANFSFDGSEFFILPGSRASAWPGDNIYRYLELSGSAWRSVDKGQSSPLKLNCSGEVNLKAFNIFLGAIHSLLQASIETLKDPKALATDLLSGIIGGYSASEFREIRMNVGGTWRSPSISKLRIGEKMDYSIKNPALPSSPGSSGSKENKIKIKIDIPTGEGSDPGVDAGDQVKKQLMENLVKQVLGDDSEEENN